MKQIFEKQNIKEGVDSKEAESDSRVRQISNTFENMMDRGKRKTTERREKQREIDKKDRKKSREQNVKRKRVDSAKENGLERLRKSDKSEKTESRVFDKVEGIEKRVEKQMVGDTAERKLEMSREERGNCVTRSKSQKSKPELSSNQIDNSRINPETGASTVHDSDERKENLKRKMLVKNVQTKKWGEGGFGRILKMPGKFENQDRAEQKVVGEKLIEIKQMNKTEIQTKIEQYLKGCEFAEDQKGKLLTTTTTRSEENHEV